MYKGAGKLMTITKDKIVATLVMETPMKPSKPENIKPYNENGFFYLNFNTCLQDFDVFNRNKRKYPTAYMVESFKSEHLIELINKRTWFGEAGHPITNDPLRIMTIDPKKLSHRINSFEIRGNRIYGNIDTLADGGFGERMARLILQGMEPAFSLRALAPLVKNADGTSVLKGKAHIVTYDWVILPSHKEAYRDQSSPIRRMTNTIATESRNQIVTESSFELAATESQIIDFILAESKNVKLVSTILEVTAACDIKISPDISTVYVKEGTDTIAIKVEDVIKNEVRSYMSKL